MLTDEQLCALSEYADAYRRAPLMDVDSAMFDLEQHVDSLLAQARAAGMEAAAVICEMHGEESESGHSDCQGCGEILADIIRARKDSTT